MIKMRLCTNLKGLKKWAWRKNLRGYFIFNGRELTDKEVRMIVEYGISQGYRTENDIPDNEVLQVLGWEEGGDDDNQ